MGFEPTTFSLARRRSTTELHPQVGQNIRPRGAESQDRTGDTAIFSRVLYQLSYLGLNVQRWLLTTRRNFNRALSDCQAKLKRPRLVQISLSKFTKHP